MHHWKQAGLITLYVAIGLVVAGMLSGVVGQFLNPILGTAAPVTTA